MTKKYACWLGTMSVISLHQSSTVLWAQLTQEMAKTLVLQLHQHLGGQDEVVDCVHHSVGGTEVALVDFGVVDEEIAVVALQEDQGVFVMVGSLEHHGVTHADTGDKTRGFRLDFLESDWLLLKHDDHDDTGKLPPSKHTGARSCFFFRKERL